MVSPPAPRNAMDVLWFRLSRRHHDQPIDARFRAPRFTRTAEHLPHGRVLAIDGKLSNFCVTGSNLTMAFALQSVNHTLSWSSTHTEYACGLPPGSFHSRHARVAGSYMPTWPVFQ